MIRASLLPLALVPLCLSCVVVNAKAVEPVPGQNSSKADRPPRKVIVGTTVFGPYGKYPGLEERLDELCDLVDEMAALTAKRYPGRGLDLSILPESAATATSGPAHDRAVPLKGEIRDTFGDPPTGADPGPPARPELQHPRLVELPAKRSGTQRQVRREGRLSLFDPGRRSAAEPQKDS